MKRYYTTLKLHYSSTAEQSANVSTRRRLRSKCRVALFKQHNSIGTLQFQHHSNQLIVTVSRKWAWSLVINR